MTGHNPVLTAARLYAEAYAAHLAVICETTRAELDRSYRALSDAVKGIPTPPAPAEPQCATCSGHGMIGGPSYYAPDEGGEPCPDCVAPAPQQPAQGWQPIATAPKDESQVILWAPRWQKPVSGQYSIWQDAWTPPYSTLILYPTLWQPLPAAPAMTASQGDAAQGDGDKVKCPGCGERGKPNGKDGEYRCGSGLSGGCTR